jgi:hypothetical protein
MGVATPKSMRLMGNIQGQHIVVLVDSGSSPTFINSVVSSKLLGQSSLDRVVSVKLANGDVLACEFQFKNADWVVQGCHFCSDLRVLYLQHFDMILGYDWLEKFSPVKLHWSAKWMAIPYGDTTVVLHRIRSEQLELLWPASSLILICSWKKRKLVWMRCRFLLRLSSCCKSMMRCLLLKFAPQTVQSFYTSHSWV